MEQGIRIDRRYLRSLCAAERGLLIKGGVGLDAASVI